MNAELENHPLFTLPPVGKQGDFHNSLADSRWIIAGNQSGKTKAGAREAAFHAVGIHPNEERRVPVPSIGWIVTLDRTFAQDVLLPELLYFTPKSLVKKIHRGDVLRVQYTNGTEVVFRTYGQGWEKFQGAKIHWAWFDEECPAAVYDETMVRLMAFQGPHWVTMTPLQGKTWIHSRIVVPYLKGEFTPEDLEIFRWTTLENTSLSAKRVEKTFGRMPAEVRAARMSGDFIDLEGLVFPQFQERIHVVPEFKLQENWPVVIGMDYGYRHPFAAVFTAVKEDGQVVVWKTYQRAEALLSQHARAILQICLDYAPHIVDRRSTERVLRAIDENRVPDEHPVIRARIRLDASAKQCKRELIPYGISADDSERNVMARVERLGELLLDRVEGRPGIVMMQGRNGYLVDNLRAFSWKRRRPGTSEDKPLPSEPQDVNDDAIDALGYALEAVPARAQATQANPPEMSPEWLRQQREHAKRIAGRMGNEGVTVRQVETRLMSLRMGRAW